MIEPIKPGDMVMVIQAPKRAPELLGAVGTVEAVNPRVHYPADGVHHACRVRFPTPFRNQDGRPVLVGWVKTVRLQKLRPPAPPPKAVPTTRPTLEGVPA